MMTNKDAQIDVLREQNKSLERERLPLVIQEKNLLMKDIEARAKEKAEAEKVTEELNVAIKKITEDMRIQNEMASEQIGALSIKVRGGIGLVAKRRTLDQASALILGVKLFQEAYIEWRLLFIRLPSFPGTIEFDTFLRNRYERINEILRRVRGDGDLIKAEELALDPGIGQKIEEIGKANYPPALVSLNKKPPLGSGG
ncbi:MAG: hypothetical protein LAP86_30240 [Acidobacteriia bacterium]|nr:hypothetical protein [Terriglobia bacterium]